jgi:glutathione peroxidase-family protein
LQTLYEKFKDQGFTELAFPSNQFKQEPLQNGEQVAEFCSRTYNVTFPIMEKVQVNGNNVHPVYAFLKSQKSGLLGLSMIKWNYEKFLVDRTGQVIERFSTLQKPEALEASIKAALEK